MNEAFRFNDFLKELRRKLYGYLPLLAVTRTKIDCPSPPGHSERTSASSLKHLARSRHPTHLSIDQLRSKRTPQKAIIMVSRGGGGGSSSSKVAKEYRTSIWEKRSGRSFRPLTACWNILGGETDKVFLFFRIASSISGMRHSSAHSKKGRSEGFALHVIYAPT
jgi:hypothetical protein